MDPRSASKYRGLAALRPSAERARTFAARRRGKASRPNLEGLEDRRLLSFSPITAYAVGTDPRAVAAADFNVDGRLDLVLANSDHSPSVLLGNGDGTFRPTGYTFGGVQSVAVGDFNRDGKPDLVALFGGRDGVAVALGNGDGTFQVAQMTYTGMTPTSVVVGDLNADGKLDLVTTSYSAWGWVDPYTGNSYGGSAGYANVLLGNGDGSFVSRGTYSLDEYSSGSSSALGDFNGDGTLDLAADGLVLLGNGDGSLRTPQTAPMYTVAAAADVNADGRLDLVGDGVALGNGDGTFQPARPYEAAGPSMRVADFNGDGKPDLAAAPYGRFTVVQLGNGDGTFRDAYHFAAGTGPSLTVGDFNGDRRLDVVTADRSADAVTVLLNDGGWAAPPAPTLSIDSVSQAEGNTGTTTYTFTVTLSAASDRDVTVDYVTADGYSWSPATGGSDYEAGSGRVTIPAGQTSGTIVVLVSGDRVAEEAAEYFFINLSDPVNAFITYAQGVGTVLDDEPSISIEPYVSGPEGNAGTTPFTFIVTLSAPYDAPVTVGYATADLPPDGYGTGATAGVDYAATSGTLTFAAGETSKTITVLVYGDRIGEDSESFLVNLDNATSARLTSNQAWGTIQDDEPLLSVDSVSKVEGNTGTTTYTFTVTLSAASDLPVSVNFATADGGATLAGGDYRAASGTLTFAAGQTSKTITVLVNGDRLGEYDETFYVVLTNAVGAAIANGTGYATILDDEPRLSVNSVSKVEGHSGTTVMTFTVTLSAAYDQAVTVRYATGDGSATVAGGDYVATSGMLTFAAGQTTKTFTVTIKGDKQKEADEYFNVVLSGASGNALIWYEYGTGTILNDDGGASNGLTSRRK